jgi:hypothetical protein
LVARLRGVNEKGRKVFEQVPIRKDDAARSRLIGGIQLVDAIFIVRKKCMGEGTAVGKALLAKYLSTLLLKSVLLVREESAAHEGRTTAPTYCIEMIPHWPIEGSVHPHNHPRVCTGVCVDVG